jgi:hypothetical protein
MEEPSGGDSGGIYPLQSSPTAADRLSISVFSISSPPPFATRRGTLYIVGFRSRRSQRDEDRRHQSNEVRTSSPHAAQASGCMGHAYFSLGPPLLHFLVSEVLFCEKTGSHKVSSNFDSVWVPES